LTDSKKIYLIGLSKAGKTSIFQKFFLKKTTDEIKKIAPTLFYTFNAANVPYLDEGITILDMGGQTKFRKQYLADPTIFRGIRTAVFVVDLTEPERIAVIEEYFQSVINIIRSVSDPMPALKKIWLLPWS